MGRGQVGGVCPKPEWGRTVVEISLFTVVLTDRVLKSKYYVNSLMRSEHKACTPNFRYFCAKINNIANNMMSL